MLVEQLLKELSVDKLDDAKQKEIKDKVDSIVDVKARERADTLLKEEREKMLGEFETKFEDYKKDITSKFSNFVDSVLDEELTIPENVMKFARKGELYDELIEQFKVRLALDEGLLDKEVRDLLSEAKGEIEKLREDVNELVGKNLDLNDDAKKMAAHIYLRKKCDGLTEDSRSKVLGILGDISEKEEIDKKFELVVNETFGLEKGTQEPKAEAHTDQFVCDKCGNIMTTKEKPGSCSKCGGSMKEVKAATPADKQGQGEMETTDSSDMKQPEAVKGPSDSVFAEAKQQWLKVLKEGRI
jgi:2-hydroxy-3-keto-5-methylthiopentenyl-1-phosphate phosphatase